MDHAVFDLVIAPWKTAIINTAVRLKVFTALAHQPMTAEEMADQLNADAILLKAMLNALVCMGLMQTQNGRYGNSHLGGIYFVDGSPYYIGNFVQLLINESPNWDNLYALASGGKEVMEQPDDELRTFIKGMHNLGFLGEVDALLNNVDIDGCTSMIDVGGGSGVYSVALCLKYPDLTATILDRAEVLAVTRELISGHECSKRIQLRECDITRDKLGEGADSVLLSDVMYDERAAATILQNVRDCLRPKGLLIIRGYYFDPDNVNPLFGALFTLNQLLFDSDRKIVTIPSLKSLLVDIGFDITKIRPLTERSFIILATK